MKYSWLLLLTLIGSTWAYSQSIGSYSFGYLDNTTSAILNADPLGFSLSGMEVSLVPQGLYVPQADQSVTSLIPNNTNDRILVYPNPFSETIHFSEQVSGALTIYNQNGQRVYHSDSRQSLQTIDLSHLKEGMYLALLRDNSNNIIESFKLIKGK